MSAEEFVLANLSAERSTSASHLYHEGRQQPNRLSESSIRNAIWQLVSRGRVTIDREMELRTRPADGR
jgi:hypothetical protein